MTACFTTGRTLAFGDCDVSGTAYYPAYLNMLNGVVEEFFARIGFPWHVIMLEQRWGTPTVHLSCDFVRPSVYGDRLVFRLAVVRVGRSSLELSHEVRCGNKVRWTARHVLAASRLDDHTAMPWPDTARAALEACRTATWAEDLS
jgi:4-hydroxybenzoyl-CoA thioesterase